MTTELEESMKHYDVECPICGTLNYNLDLEDSQGWMECEHCKSVVKVLNTAPERKIPVYTGKQLAEHFGAAR